MNVTHNVCDEFEAKFLATIFLSNKFVSSPFSEEVFGDEHFVAIVSHQTSLATIIDALEMKSLIAPIFLERNNPQPD